MEGSYHPLLKNVSFGNIKIIYLLILKQQAVSMCNMISLILMQAFPPPVFDRLQYAKTEGKAWFFYHVIDVSVYLGRQKGKRSPVERTNLRPFLIV